jgi:hypothetical protein
LYLFKPIDLEQAKPTKEVKQITIRAKRAGLEVLKKRDRAMQNLS